MGAAARHNILVFAKKYKDDLRSALIDTFVYLPVMISQACWESAYGTSSAAKNKNNFFGVMDGDTTASFSTAANAFANQIDLFNNPDHPYIANGVQTATTPYQQLRAIADSGYYSMTNDETLAGSNVNVVKGYTWNGYTWNGKIWAGSNFTAKQSADHYYNNLKAFIDDTLLVLPFGKINSSNYTQLTAALTDNPIGVLAPANAVAQTIFGIQI